MPYQATEADKTNVSVCKLCNYVKYANQLILLFTIKRLQRNPRSFAILGQSFSLNLLVLESCNFSNEKVYISPIRITLHKRVKNVTPLYNLSGCMFFPCLTHNERQVSFDRSFKNLGLLRPCCDSVMFSDVLSFDVLFFIKFLSQ